MEIVTILQNVGQYLSEAMSRIFVINDNSYPEIGTQAYTGETHTRKNLKKWKKLAKG